METETVVESRVFYSRHASFTATVKPAIEVMKDGRIQQTGSKIVEFQPIGDRFGRYSTSDPEEIASLDKNPHVMNWQQYMEESVPAEQRLQLERNDKTRMIQEKNQLVEDMRVRDLENAALKKQLKEMESSQPSKK